MTLQEQIESNRRDEVARLQRDIETAEAWLKACGAK